MLKYIPIPLNSGLDTITPALMKQGGNLLTSMNYEMTGQYGYRRIDGTERYDGWANGDITDYYRVNVTINDPAVVATLIPGATLWVSDGGSSITVATVLSYSAGVLTYVSINDDWILFPAGTIIDTVPSPITRITTTSVAVSGLAVDDADDFVSNSRAYSTILRNLVTIPLTRVAGMHWFRNNLIVALDTQIMRYADTVTHNSVRAGEMFAYNNITYRITRRVYSSPNMTLYVEPMGTNAIGNDNTIRTLTWNNTVVSVIPVTATLSTTEQSDWAYLVSYHNPETKPARGSTLLQRSVIIEFSNAIAAAEAEFIRGSLVTIGISASQWVRAYVNNVVLTGGTYAAGTATGFIELIPNAGLGLGVTPLESWVDPATMDIRDFTSVTKLADISTATMSEIAGTKRLRRFRTRYVTKTYNFYGQENTTRVYGATGASRGFWARSYAPPLTQPSDGSVSADAAVFYSWGNIVTEYVDSNSDLPKYVSLHARTILALGFEGGSVILSTPGEPLNYQGTLGAQEVATGDHITGLVEGVDDSTVIFGKRSIRRLTGITTTLASRTISGNSGALDYTAVLVGATPVFAGPNGITTLEQSQAYGEFEGVRASYKISNSLPTKLVTDRSDSEVGGTAMAMVVRSKNQYRLWLKSGQMISVTFTNEGPKIMESNYGQKYSTPASLDVRVPFAWTSEISDSGKEMLFSVWDDVLAQRMLNVSGDANAVVPNPNLVYSLDRGWGFDGVRFPHNFDIAHMFEDAGTHRITVKKVRAYGQSYGLASLNLKAVGILTDFEQPYHTRIQDLSLPRNLTLMTADMRDVTDIVDSANTGLGVKLGIYSTQLTPTETEPSHILQVLVCETDDGGKLDG